MDIWNSGREEIHLLKESVSVGETICGLTIAEHVNLKNSPSWLINFWNQNDLKREIEPQAKTDENGRRKSLRMNRKFI